MLLSLVALASLAAVSSAAIDPKRAGQGCYYTRELEKIVCAGGEPLSNVDAPVYTLNVPYNAATSLANITWEAIPVQGTADIPKTSTGVIMAPLSSKGDQFYYQGGLTCSGCPPNSGYVFDLNQKSWRKVNDEPIRFGAQGFLVNNTIYYYGGYNAQMQFGNETKPGVNHQLISIDTKSFAVNPFEYVGYPPGLLYGGCVPDSQGYLFTMIGGITHNGDDTAAPKGLVDMQTFFYARPSDNAYLQAGLRQGSAMPERRLGHTLVYNPAGQIVLFGGCNLDNKAINSNIWMFDHSLTSWIQQPTKGDPPSPRCMHSVVVIDDYMVVLFGKNADGSYVNDPVMALNMQTWEWTNELRLGTVPTQTAPPTPGASPTNGTDINNNAAKEIDNGATKSSALSGGAIAGIVVGAVVVAALAAAGGWFLSRRNHKRKTPAYDGYATEPLNNRDNVPHQEPGKDTTYTSGAYPGQASSNIKSPSEMTSPMTPSSLSEHNGTASVSANTTKVEMLRKPDGF
ncbi:uncharacterized protein BYT42DRAFT_576723 [Radiomyces spectabilis]|uniref:uncharacterized protein n=1 Tax=Radiomyces spectabilis TaxID=64574 RepID=UPI00221E96B6|nr:uncharacterized protein BYT42DRAFT_576723 [Radiomyces spectabilis]KAI8374548.1 hypothetical protein BYT42DRAFT_576723 [Radiomyces spectabilis]